MVNSAPSGSSPHSRRYVAVWLITGVLIVLWFLIAIGIGQAIFDRVGPLVLWGVAIAIMLIILGLAGHEINGRWIGILIDSRSKISLSRLQITLWTVIVLSAYLTMALPRVAAMVGDTPTLNAEQALDISFPEELMLAMGISAVSFAGSSLIKSNKKTKQIRLEARLSPESAQKRRDDAAAAFKAADDDLTAAVETETLYKQELEAAKVELTNATTDEQRALAQKKIDRAQTMMDAAAADKQKKTDDRAAKKKALDLAEAELADITASQGLLHKNSDPSEARWVDLFRGEEISNWRLVEMSKVQMLFFTVVVVAAYSAALSGVLRDVAALRTAASLSFPDFSSTLNALLAISHGTYLSVKTIDQS
jgi:hypothetical protein